MSHWTQAKSDILKFYMSNGANMQMFLSVTDNCLVETEVEKD